MWAKIFDYAIKRIVPAFIVVILVIVYMRFAHPKEKEYFHTEKVVTIVKQPKAVVGVKPTEFQFPLGAKIEFFPKDEIAKKLKMPELAAQPGGIIATGEVLPHRGKTTVVGLLTQGTDNTYRGSLLSRQEPPPFFELSHDWSVGVYYGVTGNNVIQGEVEWSPARIGPVRPNAKGEIGMERDGGGFNGKILVGVKF